MSVDTTYINATSGLAKKWDALIEKHVSWANDLVTPSASTEAHFGILAARSGFPDRAARQPKSVARLANYSTTDDVIATGHHGSVTDYQKLLTMLHQSAATQQEASAGLKMRAAAKLGSAPMQNVHPTTQAKPSTLLQNQTKRVLTSLKTKHHA